MINIETTHPRYAEVLRSHGAYLQARRSRLMSLRAIIEGDKELKALLWFHLYKRERASFAMFSRML